MSIYVVYIVRLGAKIMSEKSNIVSNVLSSLNHKIDKVFNERYKRNILNDDSYVNATPFCLNTATLDCQ